MAGLPGLLRHPVTVAEAQATLRRRLERREASFLARLRRAILREPESPYRRLLALAGCEYGDQSLLRHEDLENTLLALARAGCA